MARFGIHTAPPIRLRPFLRAQFRELDRRDPSSWPALPRHLLLALVAALVVGLLWALWLRQLGGELESARQREQALRADFRAKLRQVVSLDQLRQQRAEVTQHVKWLEQQLPGKSEIDALLSDINHAGLGRSLQFELFRPGPAVVRDHYAELPIALRASGRYHDIGAFAADLARLPRIVTLNDLSISSGTRKNQPALLQLEATAKTFRYLDDDEIVARRSAAQTRAKARK